jgi:hypothetical protein
MKNRSLLHYRWIKRAALIMAAAPLFQVSQCATGTSQVLADLANSLPATSFSILEGFLLLPLQLLWQIPFTIPTGTTA